MKIDVTNYRTATVGRILCTLDYIPFFLSTFICYNNRWYIKIKSKLRKDNKCNVFTKKTLKNDFSISL